MIETAQDFGDLVRKARRAQGLTQRELALVADVGERFIVDLEAGKPTCQLGKTLMVAAALKLRLEALIIGRRQIRLAAPTKRPATRLLLT
jgi:y4mF family transcriptional regulator